MYFFELIIITVANGTEIIKFKCRQHDFGSAVYLSVIIFKYFFVLHIIDRKLWYSNSRMHNTANVKMKFCLYIKKKCRAAIVLSLKHLSYIKFLNHSKKCINCLFKAFPC